MNHSRRFLTAASALALSSPIAAMAQSAPPAAKSQENQQAPSSDIASDDPNTIIVTATRRDESALNVPVSLAAYSQEKLDVKGIRNIEDLARITPGLTISQGFSGIKYIGIRGLSSSVGATMTGVYLDDTPVQVRSLVLSTNFYPALYDLERVEVLRGPQGTLFGAGAMGGAVRFIQAKPSLTEYSGNMRSELGITEGGAVSWEAGGAVGGPILQDKIGFRASAYYRRDGGYVDRVPYRADRGTPEENSNWSGTFVGTAALTLAPTENLTITPSLFYQKVNRHDTSQFWTFRPGSARQALPPFTSGEGVPSWNRDDARLYSVKAELDLGGISLISNTAITDRKVRSQDDSTAYLLDAYQGSLGPTLDSLLPLVGGSGPLDFNLEMPNGGERTLIDMVMTQKSFTQELRLQSNNPDSRFKYVLGAFYQNSRQTSVENDLAPYTATYLLLFPTGPGGSLAISDNRIRDKQYAAFGQLDWELIDGLTVSAGARLSRIEFDFFAGSVGSLAGNAPPTSGHNKETPVTPKFGVEYQANKNLMLYASAAKGFRSGGANGTLDSTACGPDLAAIGYTSIPRTYRADGVWSYEIGAKGRVGGFATFAASAYTIDWDDIQRTRALLSCTAVFTDNFGKARSRGFDAQVTVKPFRGLSFDIGVGYVDATQQETILTLPGATRPGTTTRKGDRFATPWTMNFAMDYERPAFSARTRVYGHVQYDFQSAWTAKPGNVGFNPILAHIDDQNFLSARIGVRTGGMDFSAFVNNLTNSRDILGRLYFAPSDRILIQTQRPRTWGITSGYRF